MKKWIIETIISFSKKYIIDFLKILSELNDDYKQIICYYPDNGDIIN